MRRRRPSRTYVDALNGFLLQTHAVGQNNVLIIDEAQNLSADVLEQLRLLTNLETNERKLLQIVLIGQPELRTMLARPELEQLAQRVIARFHLEALSQKETAHYIRHRLSVAGMTRGDALRSQGADPHPRDRARRAAPHQPALRSGHARRLCARPPLDRRRDDREGGARGVRPLGELGTRSLADRPRRRLRPDRRGHAGARGTRRLRVLWRLAADRRAADRRRRLGARLRGAGGAARRLGQRERAASHRHARRTGRRAGDERRQPGGLEPVARPSRSRRCSTPQR